MKGIPIAQICVFIVSVDPEGEVDLNWEELLSRQIDGAAIDTQG